MISSFLSARSAIARTRKHFSGGKIYTNTVDAVKNIPDGAVVMTGGFGPCGVPQNLIKALKIVGAKDLHIISNEGGVDHYGVDVLLRNNQVKKITLSYIGENKELQRRYLSGEVSCEFIPQGTLAEKIRAGGAGIPAFYTTCGIDTVVEHGGIPIRHSPDASVLVSSERKESRVFNSRRYILEQSFTADFALIKAWKGDALGNLVFRRTERNFNPDMAKASKIAIAEVEHIVPVGSIDPDEVHLPGIYVDRIIEAPCENRTENTHPRTDSISAAIRHDIARRVAAEFKDGMHVNLGIGIPALACNYLPTNHNIQIQSENGLIGVGSYVDNALGDPHLIDASKSLVSFIPGAATLSSSDAFAMIRGNRLDITVLGAFEVSQSGDLASWIIPGKIVKGE
jgi:3-oxoacid CoA-transferase